MPSGHDWLLNATRAWFWGLNINFVWRRTRCQSACFGTVYGLLWPNPPIQPPGICQSRQRCLFGLGRSPCAGAKPCKLSPVKATLRANTRAAAMSCPICSHSAGLRQMQGKASLKQSGCCLCVSDGEGRSNALRLSHPRHVARSVNFFASVVFSYPFFECCFCCFI